MKTTRRQFLKSMTAVVTMCGFLAGCSGAGVTGPSTGGTGTGGTPDEKPSDSTAKPDNSVRGLDEYRKEILRLVNIEREKAGVAPLEMSDSKLNDAAQIRAKEITESFSHTRPNGSHCSSAYKEQGGTTNYIGENIGAGYVSPAAAMNGWMNSDGHRRNILNENYRKIGIGYYYVSGSTYENYWVQMFTD